MENEEKVSGAKNKGKTFYKKWWFWVIAVLIFSAIINPSSDQTSSNTTRTNIDIEKVKVTVADFSQMPKEEIQNWCNINKVSCNIMEDYSNTVEKGLFVSQSEQANSTIYEGDKITIVYSLGKEPTIEQKNALQTAKDYLRSMPFSYTGLIKQLEYEGYTKEGATYGADNCGADWNAQAAAMAKQYMNTMSFSKSGLISQLEYEGFTRVQAEYGASAVGY